MQIKENIMQFHANIYTSSHVKVKGHRLGGDCGLNKFLVMKITCPACPTSIGSDVLSLMVGKKHDHIDYIFSTYIFLHHTVTCSLMKIYSLGCRAVYLKTQQRDFRFVYIFRKIVILFSSYKSYSAYIKNKVKYDFRKRLQI